MWFGCISIFPEFFDQLKHSITGRALESKIIEYQTFNPRDFTKDPHKRVDDRPYGGGPGMVMQYQPLHDAILAAKAQDPSKSAPVIYLSPQGEPLNQSIVSELAELPSMILVSGRYEGIDERLIKADVDREISIGDFVVSGGELPSLLLIDAVTRLLPGALGHENSADQDSFSDGLDGLLDCPHYTRPESLEGQKVPKILLSGDHQAIKRWRLQQSLLRTWQRRPNLVKRRILTKIEQQLLDEALERDQLKPQDDEDNHK